MNSSALERLASRRAALIARSTTQRDALSLQSQPIAHAISTLDQGWVLLQQVRSNPLAMAGLLLGVAIIKPRRLLVLARTSLLAWQALRTVAPLLHERVLRYRNKTGA
ncbi:YqjK family protein [Herminiimonas sp. CN]|uniref:YqjK family protein n=1 Tax=Herminiimonas sp. CN TaxID=1349818 RepID=UPI00047327B4|nr:YqjK family protein [Herminiimonas sp. CN]